MKLFIKRRLAKGGATAIIVGGTMLLINGIIMVVGIGSLTVLNATNQSGALLCLFPVFLLFELWLLGFVLEVVDKNRWMNRL
jgi:hypothetical protein